MYLKFAHQICPVIVDCLRAYAQMLCDHVVGHSARNRIEDFYLALSEIVASSLLLEIAFGRRADMLPSGANLTQAVTEFRDGSRLEENARRARVDQLLKRLCLGASGHDGDFGLRTPAARFDENFKSGCAGHDKIKHRAVGRKPLDHGDGVYTVCGDTDNIESIQGFDYRTGAIDGQGVIIGDHHSDWHFPSWAAVRNRKWPTVRLTLACLIFIFQTSIALAQDAGFNRTLILNGPVDVETVGRHVDLMLDPARTMELPDVMGDRASGFSPITGRVVDVGYTDAMVWLRLNLENEGREAVDWRLHFQENFKQVFHVYIVDAAGVVSHPMAQNADSPFSVRPISYPQIVVPLALGLGDRATVYVRFWTEALTRLPLSIETVESFTAISIANAAKQSIFYGMMIIMIGFAVVAGLVLRHPVLAAYIGYASATLIYIMHVDGFAFQYLWPNLPVLNWHVATIAGGLYGLFGVIFCRIFLSTAKHHPIIDKLLVGMIVVFVGLMIAAQVGDQRIIKRYMLLAVLCAMLLYTLAALLAARNRFKPVRFYLAAWLVAVGSGLLMTLRHWFGLDVSEQFQHDTQRAVMIFDAFMLGLAIIDRFNQVRESRQKALRLSLKQAQRNLEMSTRLRNLETRYELALQTTNRHREHMENAIHDIRQPLHALRLAVQGSVSDANSGTDRHYREINESFDYIEGLFGDFLNPEGSRSSDAQGDLSDIRLGEILGSIHEMFAPDAKAKGLNFTYVPTSVTVPVKPLVMMRIVSNLVSNAIKYTPSGRVLLGVRQRGDGVRIEIHDSGPGLTMEEFQKACGRGERLPSAQTSDAGHGFGLAIVIDLARQPGYRLELLGERGGGTSIGLTVPM